jgi:GGDEF domain-containing protein
VADRVVKTIREPFMIRGEAHAITISIGIAYSSAPAHGGATALDAGGVLGEADTAMYRAKREGKNRIAIAVECDSDDASARQPQPSGAE